MIAAPASSEGTHLQILSRLARKIMDDEFCDELRAETDPAALAATLTREVQD
ncbi:MAG: PTS sugar transporter subunit IIA [Micrococcales bacterium]